MSFQISGSRNLKWFILCFLFGACFLLLWPGSSLHETDIFIPVDIGKTPEGLTITGPPLRGIEVRVRGPKALILTLSDLNLRYVLDLSGIDAGVKSIPINQDHIRLPNGISIISINPSCLTVRAEKEVERKLPVIITFSGKPASGFLVADAVAKPSSVILRGPESILGFLEEVPTKPIDINGLSESFKRETALYLAEEIDVLSSSGIILAEIFIEEKIVTKEFHDIPVEGKDSPYIYNITPPAINIVVKGPVNILEKLHRKNGLKVYVDLKELKPGVYVRRAAITLPVKTTLVGVKPEIFTVEISDRNEIL